MLAAGSVARLARDAELRDLSRVAARLLTPRSGFGVFPWPGVVTEKTGLVPGRAARLLPEVVRVRGEERAVRVDPALFADVVKDGQANVLAVGPPVQALLNPVRSDETIDLKRREPRSRNLAQVAMRPRQLCRPGRIDGLHLKLVTGVREPRRQALVFVDCVREVPLDVFRSRFARHRAVVRATP